MALSDPSRPAPPLDRASAWLDDAPRQRGGRWRYRKGPSPRRNAAEWAVILVCALSAALIIRTFVFQAFYIPSPSMTNTLQVGNRVLINKLSYRFHDVHHGDIVVFRKPNTARAQQCYAEDDIEDLIKRVVALPGETVELKDGQLYVNDEPVKESYIKPGSGAGDPLPRTQVPPGSVWVMGDNREQSRDSRCAGPIPEKDILGRAFLVLLPLDSVKVL